MFPRPANLYGHSADPACSTNTVDLGAYGGYGLTLHVARLVKIGAMGEKHVQTSVNRMEDVGIEASKRLRFFRFPRTVCVFYLAWLHEAYLHGGLRRMCIITLAFYGSVASKAGVCFPKFSGVCFPKCKFCNT